MRKKRTTYRGQRVTDRAAAETLVRQWTAEGWDARVYDYRHWLSGQTTFFVNASRQTETLRVPQSTTMPRHPTNTFRGRNPRTGEPIPIEKSRAVHERLRLFTVATRRYLRRRTWRYFRKLGKNYPERYVRAITGALKGYEDADVADGLALIDNWGLTHVLFHHSPVLVAHPNGWKLAPGRGLSELVPAPLYESLWKDAPRQLIELIREGRCRPVRRWALFMLRRDHDAVLRRLPPEELFGLLAHEDLEVARLGAELLRELPDLADLGAGRFLSQLEKADAERVEILCDLLAERFGPEHVTFAQAVELAGVRPLPAARLGFAWLKTKRPDSDTDCQILLQLAEARAEPLRPEIVRWVREKLQTSPHFQPGWVLEFLDSRHADVRAEGWSWFQAEERVREDVDLWQKLLESPHDDVRLQLVGDLERRAAAGNWALLERGPLDTELLHFLWASVLLNVQRGGRTKPLAVGQLVRRVERKPAEAKTLLPILAVALRSVRGPEWRSGLTGLVRLVERKPDLAPLVNATFPELKLVI
jgi:hypothetical protein